MISPHKHKHGRIYLKDLSIGYIYINVILSGIYQMFKKH
jgi:hypothetical protein